MKTLITEAEELTYPYLIQSSDNKEEIFLVTSTEWEEHEIMYYGVYLSGDKKGVSVKGKPMPEFILFKGKIELSNY